MLGVLDVVYKDMRHLKILDAGAGTGWFSLALERYGYVTALDIEKEALRVCKERGIKILQGDVAAIPAPDASFDLVVCSEVLYHQYVKDDALVIKEFCRVLKPGGRVLVKVPAHAYLWGAHDRMNLTRKRYEPEDIRNIFLSNGFVIEKLTYANFFLFPAVYIKRKCERIRSSSDVSSDIRATPVVLNFLLANLLRFEAFLLRYIDLPQGSSIVCLGRKI